MSNSSAGPRTGACVRETAETSIRVRVRLDGHGVAKVTCPVRFLGHMLEQIARHGRMDLEVEATGDVEVDAHHTVEDVGIALGQALRQAIAGGAGLERFGHARCPLDEALSDVTVDLSGRSFLVVRMPELPERIGDLPSELVEDFLLAFSRHLKANIHVHVPWGRNGHHIVEATFKALARALHAATRRTRADDDVPSTKGTIA